MRVGLTFDLRNPSSWRRPWAEVWDENLAMMREAEELGFDALWIQEHFFTGDGYAPSLPIFLTRLIEATASVRVGAHVYVLPLHHPVALAQEIAVLDQLAGGRLDVGFGLGHRLPEYAALGVDPATRVARLEEAIEVMVRAWGGERFEHHGRFYDFAELEVQPTPLQRPTPPLWMASTVVASARRAGRLGMHMAGSSAEPEVYDAYRAALAERGSDPAQARAGAVFSVTTTRERAADVYARNRAFYRERWSFYSVIREEMGMPELTNAAGSSEEDPYEAFELVGDPELILERLAGFHRDLGFTDLMLMPPAAGIPASEGLESLRLFAAEVLPELQRW